MLLSGRNIPLERQMQMSSDPGTSIGREHLAAFAACRSHIAPPPCAFLPAPQHLSWLFTTLHTYSSLAAVSQFFGFPIWPVLLARLLFCSVSSCHLLFSRHYAESWSCKTGLCPCLSSSWKLVSSKHLPDALGEKPLLPLRHYLCKKKNYWRMRGSLFFL